MPLNTTQHVTTTHRPN